MQPRRAIIYQADRPAFSLDVRNSPPSYLYNDL